MLKRFSLIPDTKHYYPHTEGDSRAMCTATQKELFRHSPGNMTKVLRFNLASQFHTSPALECCWYGRGRGILWVLGCYHMTHFGTKVPHCSRKLVLLLPSALLSLLLCLLVCPMPKHTCLYI